MELLVIGMNGVCAQNLAEVEIKPGPEDVTIHHLSLADWTVTVTLLSANAVIWTHVLLLVQPLEKSVTSTKRLRFVSFLKNDLILCQLRHHFHFTVFLLIF